MRQNSILNAWTKGLLAIVIATLYTTTAMAQGIQVHTKAGKTVNYPAGTFSHISPYIYGLSGSDGTQVWYGVDVYKTDGSSDTYMENDLESITTYEAAADEEGDPQTSVVPQTGGTVTMGDLTLYFPAATFNSDAPTTVTEAKAGFIDGDAELSKYYKVKFADGVRKGFKVAVRMPQLPDDEFVRMQFAMMGWATSLDKEYMVRRYMDVTYIDGAYVAEIPEMESPDEVGGIEVWFGITTCDPGPSPSAARRVAGDEHLVGRDDYGLYKYLLAFGSDEFKDLYYDLKYSWIPAAMGKLEELGFSKGDDSRIEYYLVNLGEGGTGGFYTRSPWGKKYSEIYLNYSALAKQYKSGDKDEIRATVLHETFHYYQWFYDSRKAAIGHSEATILEEASSVWSERFHTPTPSIAKGNATMFVPSINPVYRDILLPSQGRELSWGDRFQNMGYGMSTLLEYLTQRCGNKIILDIWEDRKAGDPYDFRDRIERAAKLYGIDIFTQDTYHDFLEKLGCKNIYEDLGFDDLITFREQHDSIGVLVRRINDTKLVYFTNYLYDYGGLVEKYEVSGFYDNDNDHGLDHATGLIEQTTPNVTTWVYRAGRGGKYFPCGTIRKGAPLKISPDWFYKRKVGNMGQYEAYIGSAYSIFFLTIPDNFTTTDKPVSRIAARVLTLDVPEKTVSLPAREGGKDLKLKSNYADLTVKPTVDWMTCYWIASDSTLKVRYEELPAGMESRKGSIQIFAPSEDGTELVLEEIELSQLKAFIDLSTAEVEVPVKGGTHEVNITSTNCTDIKVSTESSFLHPVISGNTITVKVDENFSYDQRDGYVVVDGVEPTQNIPVRRNIHFTQAGTITPEPVDLYNDGHVDAKGLRISIPGKTYQYGDKLLYRSGDTQVTKYDKSRTEFSWNVELYIDPKDNKSMRHYEFCGGSVTWLRNFYYTETDNEGHTTEHQYTTRCSYSLKNLTTTDGLSFHSRQWSEEEPWKLSDFISDYSYQETRDGKPVTTVMQADIADEQTTRYSAYFQLQLADGIPYLEADRDSVIHDGSDGFEIIKYTSNEAVFDIEVTTSADWLTIDRMYQSEYGGRFYLNNTINKTKAPREGYVYITGTLADGSKLTRTIVVQQIYEAIWDDDLEENEEQKAELPSQAVLNALAQGGMPLYLGDNPPKLNGVYKMEPLQTIYEYGIEGGGNGEYASKSLVFRLISATSSGDSNKALMSYYNNMANGNSTPAEDYNCYLGGDGNSFTLSNIMTESIEGLFSFTIVTMLSGTLEGNQVRDLHFASVIIDENGEIEELSIGTDGDGLSPTTEWKPGE